MAEFLSEYWLSEGQGRTRRERMGGEYHPYVPDTLMGRDLMFQHEVVAAISAAEGAITRFNDQCGALSNTEALAQLILRAEAVASSRIEGLEVSPRNLLLEEFRQKAASKTQTRSTAAEVLGNIDAMRLAMGVAASGSAVDIDTFCAINKVILGKTERAEYAGVIRNTQNWIGGNDYNPCNADFVPPPPVLVPTLLEDLASFVNNERISPVLQAALAHAQFETIHPFADGNGRTGRALIQLILKRRGLSLRAVPPISLVLATLSRGYVYFLGGYRYVGDADSAEAHDARGEWVEFFADCCLRAVNQAEGFERQIDEIAGRWRKSLRSNRGSAADLLMAALPGMPVVSVETAAKAIGRSDEAVRLAIKDLVDVGILNQTSKGRRNRTFEAAEIIDAFRSFERQLASPDGDTRTSKPVRPVPQRKR
jgi:Fic family protein